MSTAAPLRGTAPPPGGAPVALWGPLWAPLLGTPFAPPLLGPLHEAAATRLRCMLWRPQHLFFSAAVFPDARRLNYAAI